MPLSEPKIITKHKARDHTDRAGCPIKKIIIHATAGTNSLSWLSGNINGTSIHVLIAKDGTCYKMLDEDTGANHVGYSRMVIDNVVYSRAAKYNCNQITLGIELENLNNGRDPYPKAQLDAAAWWIKKWLEAYGLTSADILMHRTIDTQGKSDPRGLSPIDFINLLAEDKVGAGLANTLPIISRTVHGSVESAVAYLGQKRTDASYTAHDHRLIASYYWNFAQECGIDPAIAFAQMIHETGHLTSWWSLRPRRNPAGLGVTGTTNRIKPREPDWQFDEKAKLWKRGCAFPDWQHAVRAHIGHLVCYAVPVLEQSESQKRMVLFDPRAPGMPAAYRGTAHMWQDLNGRWAVPGDNYSQAIMRIANEMVS